MTTPIISEGPYIAVARAAAEGFRQSSNNGITFSLVRDRYIDKPHPLDVKYSHVCYSRFCGKQLRFEELFQANTKNEYYRNGGCFDIPLYRKLKKLWRSKDVEFFCCTCFKLQIS